MLNKTGLNKSKVTLKEKRFVRSRSRSQQNPIESPRSNHTSTILKTFCTKFIRASQPYKNNLKQNYMNQSLRTDCDNNLPMKLKIIQLQEQLSLTQLQKKQLIDEVSKLKQELKVLQEIVNSDKQLYNKENDSIREVNKTKRNQNLQKLKRQIAESRLAEPVSEFDKLRNQNTVLKNENNRIKCAYNQAQISLKDYRVYQFNRRTQLQQLQSTIAQMQKTIKRQQQQNRNLDLRIKVLLAKQANFSQNAIGCSKQAFQQLRSRYTKLMKQHKAIKKQMAALRQKPRGPERPNRFSTQPDFRSRSVSLSLSPEDK